MCRTITSPIARAQGPGRHGEILFPQAQCFAAHDPREVIDVGHSDGDDHVVEPAPKMATRATARMITGKAQRRSTAREMTLSTQRP